MLGFRPYKIYFYLWKYVSPLFLIVLISATVIEMAISPPGYNAWVQDLVSVCVCVCVNHLGHNINSVWTADWSFQRQLQSCFFHTPLCVPAGSGTLRELPSLGADHVLHSNHRGHASSPHCLHRPPLQPDVRRLQQAVRLLP